MHTTTNQRQMWVALIGRNLHISLTTSFMYCTSLLWLLYATHLSSVWPTYITFGLHTLVRGHQCILLLSPFTCTLWSIKFKRVLQLSFVVLIHLLSNVRSSHLSSAVDFTYPYAIIGRGLPTLSIACTHRFTDVKRVVATSPVANTLRTSNTESTYLDRLCLAFGRGATSHAKKLIDVLSEICGCPFRTKIKSVKRTTCIAYSNISYHLFSTFPPHVVYSYLFHFVNGSSNVKTSFICTDMYLIISFTS